MATGRGSVRITDIPTAVVVPDASSAQATAAIIEAAAATKAHAAISSVPLYELVTTLPLQGLSQIFLVDSALSGFGILVGIGTFYSPLLVVHAFLGSTVGTLAGYFCSLGSPEQVAIGLWGYNSALTSMGIGVFCVASPNAKDHRSSSSNSNYSIWALSAGGAAATAVCFGALQNVCSPILTLPFCVTMSACYQLVATEALGGGLRLAESPHSPERNAAIAIAARKDKQ